MKNANKVMIVLALATFAASSHIYARIGFHIAHAQPINPGAQLGLSPLEPPRVPANGERLPDDQPHQQHQHDNSNSVDSQVDSSDKHNDTDHSSGSSTSDNSDKNTIAATATITDDSHNLDQHTAATDSVADDGTQQQHYTGIVPSNR